MDNYSPSHPTEEAEMENSVEGVPKDNSYISPPKDVKPEVVNSVNNWKAIAEDDEAFESSAWDKELEGIKSKSPNVISKSQLKSSKRSRSKSVEKRSKRSRSRSGQRRRRSRSISKNRHSRSRSRDRSGRNDTRNESSRHDRDSRKLRSRSKSPPGRRDSTKRSRTPEPKKDNNIFNKMTDLQSAPSNDQSKEKWSYDSDEEASAPKVIRPVQDSSQDERSEENSFGRRQNFSDRRGRGGFQRGTERGNYRGDFEPRNRQWTGNDRSDFQPRNKQWSGSNSGDFEARNKPWGGSNTGDSEPRNKPWSGSNTGDSEPRNKPWPTNNSGDSEPRNKPWGGSNTGDSEPRNKPWGGSNTGDSEARNKPWQTNNSGDSEPRNKPWGGSNTGDSEPRNKPWQTNNSGDSEQRNKPLVSSEKNSCVPTKGGDSDEEYESWGKKDKADRIPEMSDPVVASRTQPGDNRATESNDGGRDTLASVKRVNVAKPNEKFAENSDDECGAWGRKNQTMDEPAVSGAIVEPKRAIPKASACNSDEEFGAWGSEQKSTKATTAKDAYANSEMDSRANYREPGESHANYRESNESYANYRETGDSRPNYQSNQYGQRRGGGMAGIPRNFNNNSQFPPPPNQDRFYNNNSNTLYPGTNYSSNAGGAPMPPCDNVPPPLNYGYKPPQMPQWAMQAQYAPHQTAPLPFTLDTTVCPPMMAHPPPPQQHPMHVPPLMQMMSQPMPFIPPPPPNMAMDVHGSYMPPMHHSINSSQSAISNNQSNFVNKSALSMNQNVSNLNQSDLSVLQSIDLHQSDTRHSLTAGLMAMDNNNLLETLMTKAGLSSDTLRLTQEKMRHDPTAKSVSDTFSSILKTAASSVITRLVENAKPPISDNMSMSPPSPPSNSPPPSLVRYGNNVMQIQSSGGFVPPPLPCYADVLKPSVNKIIHNIPAAPPAAVNAQKSNDHPDEEKRNRNDFASKSDWQERVAMEVKVFLKPAYMSRAIDKNEYKDIMKRSVTKITRSGVMEINADKIEKFVLSYVDKYNKNRKVKQHSAVSSSERDLRYD